MFHSYLAVRHLIRELEMNGRPARRLTIPEWLTGFLSDATDDLDTPLNSARAGYECRVTEKGWEVSLFLGASEVVGGACDGQRRPTPFRLNLGSLMNRFERVDSVEWVAQPSTPDQRQDESMVSLTGQVHGSPLTLHVRATPVNGASPAIRQYHDGRVELV